MTKYKYNVSGMHCANCAKRMEDYLSNQDNFKNVIVNFNTCKLTYESDKEYSLKELNKLVKNVDNDFKITSTNEQTNIELKVVPLLIGTIIGLLAYFLNIPSFIKVILYIISFGLLLYRNIFNAIKTLIKGHYIDENLLISISCIGALLIGEALEGMMVIILYSIGKILEGKAVNKGRNSIKELVELKVNYANVKNGKEIKKISVDEVKIGDIIVVKKGEKIPVDGQIIKGSTYLDTSSLTGESIPLKVNINDEVLSGTINTMDVIEIKALKLFSDSTVSKILELLEEATNKKAKTENLVSKISKVYTPMVLLFAIISLFLLPVIFNISFNESLYRSLTFLVISCPCAIAISVPLAYFNGIGISSRNGILVKGSNYLDNLSNAKRIVFDKTGTLTYAKLEVKDIIIKDNNYSKDEIINILRLGESLSNHPIANAIMELSDEKIDNSVVKNFKEIDGSGITFNLDKKRIKIGNSNLCNCNIDTNIHLNINDKHVASIIINDGIKDNAKDVINSLKPIKTYMFTGDKKDIAEEIADELDIDVVKANMLPQDKYYELEKIMDDNITVFVGDGVNDAPTLKLSNIGISMGNIGSDSAINASDIVIINDDLSKIPLAMDISKYTKMIIKQNLIFAISVKLIILLLSIFGLTNMWMAVFADTGLTVLTILNTLRILRKFK